MFSLKLFIHANIAYITVERLSFVNSAYSAFFTVVGEFIIAGEMFAKWTKVGRHSGFTARTVVGILINFFLMTTTTAFIVGCFKRLGLYVGTLLTVIVTTMAGIKNVAALKFYPAASAVVLATWRDLEVDGVLRGRP